MVFSRELPHSFSDALRVCKEILSANHQLVIKNTLETEAEQLVVGAFRIASGEMLSRNEMLLRLQDAFPEAAGEKLLILAGTRLQGVPLQYVLGYQAFLEHEYDVNASTLIPRPETEVLVTEAIRNLKSPTLGIEVGLGSGIISIEHLHHFKTLRMKVSELSVAAQDLARKNAVRILGDDSRIQIYTPADAQDVLGRFQGIRVDFIISNPPYLDSRAGSEVEEEVLRHEPRAALFPESPNGEDALHFYRQIALEGRDLLNPGGQVFLEIAHERADETAALFKSGWSCRLENDLSGRPRVLIARVALKGL
jgi:release factor glutamine methyltransferase